MKSPRKINSLGVRDPYPDIRAKYLDFYNKLGSEKNESFINSKSFMPISHAKSQSAS